MESGDDLTTCDQTLGENVFDSLLDAKNGMSVTTVTGAWQGRFLQTEQQMQNSPLLFSYLHHLREEIMLQEIINVWIMFW